MLGATPLERRRQGLSDRLREGTGALTQREMTGQDYIVNQQGGVYQKNLGAGSTAIAAAMTEYDPDLSWKLVAP